MGERREKRGFGVWGVHKSQNTNTAESRGCDFCFNCVFLSYVFLLCVVCTKNYEA